MEIDMSLDQGLLRYRTWSEDTGLSDIRCWMSDEGI